MSSGAVLINQLIEKEMREQNDQQNKKLREIKQRTAAIRESYEKQQLSAGGILAFTPQTYGQGKAFGLGRLDIGQCWSLVVELSWQDF